MEKQEDSTLRGNSAGKVGSSDRGQKELPRYLRASTGSCHDLCKYGRRHASEEKPWRAKVRRTVKKLPDDMTKASSSESSETKKMIEVKKTQALDCSDGVSKIIKREVVRSSGRVSAMATPPPSERRDSLQKKTKTTNSRLKSSPVSGSPTSGNDNTLKQKVMSRSHSIRATLLSKETKPIHGQVSSVGLKPVMGKGKGVKGSDVKVEKKIGATKVALKKMAISPGASFSPKSSSIRIARNSSLRKSQCLKVSASTRNQRPIDVRGNDEPKQLDSYSIEENTLPVVEMEAENRETAEQCIVKPSPPPSASSSSSSSATQKDGDLGEYEEYTVSEAGEYDDASGSNGPESAEEEDGTVSGEKKPRASNNGDSAKTEAGKLHFRRGRVVDINSESGSPRRIKFRQGRALGENQTGNGHGKRRSFKRKDDIAEGDDDNQTGENVVLRHQEVQGKKEEQGLLNNVIEETASKLVETRKSKVKALVGAFETVISLQESKPSANSAT